MIQKSEQYEGKGFKKSLPYFRILSIIIATARIGGSYA